MGIEKKVVSGKLDEDNAEFLAWLSKQGDDGFGITKSSVLNRMTRFLRDLYCIGESAMTPTGVQVLLRQSGLPQLKEVEGPGLSPSGMQQPQQARFHFFSRRRAVQGMAASFHRSGFRLPFAPHSSTWSAA